MTKEQRNELLNLAVNRLQEAAKLLAQAEEELLSDQVSELADLVTWCTVDNRQRKSAYVSRA
jgi:hypothetical protein